MSSLVTSIFLYACESWTLTAELQRRIQAMEMRCYRKILRILSFFFLLFLVLPQDTTYLIQRPCCQRGSPCQDPAGNRTTRRPPDTNFGGSCLPFIRSSQKHLARHSERGKKTRWTKEEVGRQHQGMDRPGVRQVPEGGGQWRTGKNGENWLRNHLWCPNDPRG